MSRRSKTTVDPQALERIRTVRAAEDSAITELFRHVGLVEAAQRRRAEALLALDADVRDAEDALAEARDALVRTAGMQRSAAILGVTPATLRRLLPSRGQPTQPGTPRRVTLSQDGE